LNIRKISIDRRFDDAEIFAQRGGRCVRLHVAVQQVRASAQGGD
jgi:hypothetical protein